MTFTLPCLFRLNGPSLTTFIDYRLIVQVSLAIKLRSDQITCYKSNVTFGLFGNIPILLASSFDTQTLSDTCTHISFKCVLYFYHLTLWQPCKNDPLAICHFIITSLVLAIFHTVFCIEQLL